MATIPVRKPNHSEFVRVSPNPKLLATSIYVDPVDRETYFVAPEMRSVLTGGVKAMLLVTAVDQRGTAAADKTLGTRVRARRPSLRKRNAPRSCPT